MSPRLVRLVLEIGGFTTFIALSWDLMIPANYPAVDLSVSLLSAAGFSLVLTPLLIWRVRRYVFENGAGSADIRGSLRRPAFWTAFVVGCAGVILSWILASGPGVPTRFEAVFGVGLLMTILLSLFIWSLVSSRSRALSLAKHMTRDLARAQEEADKALANFSSLKEAIDQHVLVSTTDAAGTIITANDKFCAVSGFSREELIGANHRLITSNHHPAPFWRNFWQLISNGHSFQGEICNRAKDGRLYWVQTTVLPFRDADGKIEKYISVRTDITRRKESEQRILDSERYFRALSDASPALIWVSGPEGELTHVNRAWLEFTGRRLECELASGWKDHLHPDDLKVWNDVFCEHLRSRSRFQIELRLRRHDGSYRWLIHGGAPQIDDDGRFLGFVGMAVDVNESHELRVEAQAACRAKSEFLANMSHEIRTPLTAILGYTDILRDEIPALSTRPEHRKTLEGVAAAGRHLLSLINDILDLSKIESGQLTTELVDVDFPALVLDVLRTVEPQAKSKGLRLEASLVHAIPRFLRTDPTRVRQILINLVGNAIKFTSRGAVLISIEAVKSDSAFLLKTRIIDTGEGLSPGQFAKLFSPFHQADSSVTRRHGGTGLGLVISRRLAQVLGGDVVLIASGPGVGSTFEWSMPVIGDRPELVSELEVEATTPKSEATPGLAKLNARVLVAEDGRDNQVVISLCLRKAGAEVDVADNGRLALGMIRNALKDGRAYDLLLTDIQMPEMDGYTLVKQLRADGLGLPIVALTAHAMAEDRERCLNVGCSDFETKPIDRARLLATCRRWVESTRRGN